MSFGQLIAEARDEELFADGLEGGIVFVSHFEGVSSSTYRRKSMVEGN